MDLKSAEVRVINNNGCKENSQQVEKSSTNSCGHENFLVVTVVAVTYLIETISQIILIINCYRSLYISTASNENWLWTLLIALVVSSLLVTIISIIWTLRGMDFSGRACGQFVCYLMHLSLLGFVWRYLKITLAYEYADVIEFLRLRKFQVFVQSLPLVALHLAYFTNTVPSGSMTTWIIGVELCCSITSLVFLDPVLRMKNDETSDHKQRQKVTSEINTTIMILFLISRVIVVGLLISFASYWALLVIMAHLLTTFMWTFLTTLVFRDQRLSLNTVITRIKSDIESGSHSCSEENQAIKQHLKNSFVASYTLFYDLNVNSDVWCLSLPVLLVFVENVAVLIFHLTHSQATILLVVIGGTCLLCGILMLLVTTTWNKWDTYMNSLQMMKTFTAGSGPVVDPPQNNEKDGKYGETGIILGNPLNCGVNNFHCCHHLTKKTRESEQQQLEAREDDAVINTGTYERINETLMTAVNSRHEKGEGEREDDGMKNGVDENPGLVPDFSELIRHIGMLQGQTKGFKKPHDSSPISTNSRNTNTLSITSLSNSPHPGGKGKDKSSPLIIRKASKVQLLTRPKCNQIGSMSRCPCKWNDKHDTMVSEKLIEDAYGILICEGECESKKGKRSIKQDSAQSTLACNKKLRVLCAKCLGNHDPLLSNCEHATHFCRPSTTTIKRPFDSPNVYSETTEYPTDTEFTCTLNDLEDQMSISTKLSVTYVNLPQHNTGKFLNHQHQFNECTSPLRISVSNGNNQKELTGMDYVRAWLLMNDIEKARGYNSASNNNYSRYNRPNNRSLSRLSYNQLSSKSKHICKSRPNSAFAHLYKTYPTTSSSAKANLQLKPPPKQKQHPSWRRVDKLEERLESCNPNSGKSSRVFQFRVLDAEDLLETVV